MMEKKNAPFISPLQSMKVKNPQLSKGAYTLKIPHICTSKRWVDGNREVDQGRVEALPAIPSRQEPGSSEVSQCPRLWPLGCSGSRMGATEGP